MQKESEAIGFEYDLEETDGIVLVSLRGRIIGSDDTSRLIRELESWILNGRKHVILNLLKVEYINSNGLNGLITILTKTRTNGGDVILSNINERVQKLLLITKLNTVFTIVTSNDDALEKLKSLNLN